ncbi:hypothetical protein EST38_g2537 [Candolleomyces aberdarensis]|uniref:Cytochrome P450 n=1 Tax=Candolleomyces aberdarensis TaxID=2316362 RepID=A0A4Q2DVR2_9AGAR|nr:hypothetical protein EST38_g2537 [Candolleomyces aberdarensis]
MIDFQSPNSPLLPSLTSAALAFTIYSILRRILREEPFRDIPGPKAESWTMGNLKQLFNSKGLPFHESLTDKFGGIAKVYGFFGLVKVLSNEITGSELAEQTKENGTGKGRRGGVLDMSEWISRVSLEMVGRAILGYSFDPLDSRVNNPYTSAIKELIPTLFSFALARQFTPFVVKLGPAWFRRKLVEWMPSRRVQKVKEISDVMHDYAGKILKERRDQQTRLLADGEDSGESGRPKDVISMLLKANEKAQKEERMSDDELTGQMTVLIFGAQDTTSSALSRIIYLLSTHPEVQEQVRAELREAHRRRRSQSDDDEQENGRLDQETIMSLPWLDAVVKETLRMYPSVPFVRRSCVKETTIPYTPLSDSTSDSHPQTTSVRVPKGTTIFIGIQGMNRLEEVWGDDAKEWKPQRWMSDSTTDIADGTEEERKSSTPYKSTVKIPAAFCGMLSFLGGGRACIGLRFAMIEMKIILATIFSKMHFEPTEDEIIWNLSQIISPSVRKGSQMEEKGMPVRAVLDDLTV